MKREFFKIIRIIKKFNQVTKSFNINISYKTATTVTPRTSVVAEAFGLGIDTNRNQILYDKLKKA